MTFNTTPFIDLIQQRTGITLNDSRIDELEGGVRQRMKATALQSASGYYDLVQHDRIEFFKLVNLFTINETYFFREFLHIQIMARRLIRERMAETAPGNAVRIMSAGCSTGEEPYSLAIAILENYGWDRRGQFSIIGADIDGDAIERAKTGLFTGNSFRSEPFRFSDRYFDAVGRKKYRIKPEIKKMVDFHTVNLTTGPYPDYLSNMDIIFYRNVSIYFSPEVQRRVFRNLADVLKENGYLIMSSTETLSHSFGILNLMEIDGRFIFKKTSPVPLPAEPSVFSNANDSPVFPRVASEFDREPVFQFVGSDDPPPAGADPLMTFETDPVHDAPDEPEPEPEPEPARNYESVIALARQKKYVQALETLNRISDPGPEDNRIALLKAEILINLNRLEDAGAVCRKITEDQPLFMEGHLLAGIIAKQQREMKDAAKCFKRALYVNPSSWLARFHLAEIQQSMFDNARATQGYQTVMQSIESGGYANHGLNLFNASFSMNDIMNLCRLRISQMFTARSANGV